MEFSFFFKRVSQEWFVFEKEKGILKDVPKVELKISDVPFPKAIPIDYTNRQESKNL